MGDDGNHAKPSAGRNGGLCGDLSRPRGRLRPVVRAADPRVGGQRAAGMAGRRRARRGARGQRGGGHERRLPGDQRPCAGRCHQGRGAVGRRSAGAGRDRRARPAHRHRADQDRDRPAGAAAGARARPWRSGVRRRQPVRARALGHLRRGLGGAPFRRRLQPHRGLHPDRRGGQSGRLGRRPGGPPGTAGRHDLGDLHQAERRQYRGELRRLAATGDARDRGPEGARPGDTRPIRTPRRGAEPSRAPPLGRRPGAPDHARRPGRARRTKGRRRDHGGRWSAHPTA